MSSRLELCGDKHRFFEKQILPDVMSENFEQKVAEAIASPRNVGELAGADAVGTVGSPGCGDMMRLWIKFREEQGRKVIDKATFQAFGCETAIAVASLATELIRGKTPEEALALKGAQLAPELGPLPPMKIHCGEMVEGALRDALAKDQAAVTAPPPAASAPKGGLVESLGAANAPAAGKRIVFLKPGQ
jgi:NifU-like protein involved in Fe-S cluster formation